MLSTIHRTWLCRMSRDESTGELLNEMEIIGPFASSEKAERKYPNMPRMPYLKMAFLTYMLMHESKITIKDCNELISNKSLSSEKVIEIVTPSSMSPFFGQPILRMPDFSNVKNIEVYLGKRAFLWEYEDYFQVFTGCVDGTKVAVKVSVHFLMLFSFSL